MSDTENQGGPVRSVIILSDGRPGHYRQSEGVSMALAKFWPTDVTRVTLKPRQSGLTRGLAHAVARGLVWPSPAMRLGYGLDPARLAPPDVIISAGGRTLLANIALARRSGAPNIFAGTLRGLPAEAFSAIVLPYADVAGKPHHVRALKPAPIDPDAMRRPAAWRESNRLALLVGGPSGAHRFSEADWAALVAILADPGRMSLRVVTSPRTPASVADRLAAAARPRVDAFVDFRTAGPGSIEGALDWADAVACTEDSSSMIAEAVSARRPVVALLPAERQLRADEAGMFADLAERRLIARLKLTGADVAAIDQALASVEPLQTNPLHDLAGALAPMLGWRLPD